MPFHGRKVTNLGPEVKAGLPSRKCTCWLRRRSPTFRRERFGTCSVSEGKPDRQKKVLAHPLPMAVVDEEVLQPREPFGVADPEIAGLELVSQLQ